MVAPLLAGPLVDRLSRRRTIYTLDFFSSLLDLGLGLLLRSGDFNLPLLGVAVFIIGTVNSVYQVAYTSFYPLLIPDGCYSKAYSVSTILETLSALMIPISSI